MVGTSHHLHKVPYNLCRSPSYFANHQVDRLGLAADGTEPIKWRSNYRLIRRCLCILLNLRLRLLRWQVYSIHNGLYPPSYLCHYEVGFAHSED